MAIDKKAKHSLIQHQRVIYWTNDLFSKGNAITHFANNTAEFYSSQSKY